MSGVDLSLELCHTECLSLIKIVSLRFGLCEPGLFAGFGGREFLNARFQLFSALAQFGYRFGGIFFGLVQSGDFLTQFCHLDFRVGNGLIEAFGAIRLFGDRLLKSGQGFVGGLNQILCGGEGFLGGGQAGFGFLLAGIDLDQLFLRSGQGTLMALESLMCSFNVTPLGLKVCEGLCKGLFGFVLQSQRLRRLGLRSVPFGFQERDAPFEIEDLLLPLSVNRLQVGEFLGERFLLLFQSLAALLIFL